MEIYYISEAPNVFTRSSHKNWQKDKVTCLMARDKGFQARQAVVARVLNSNGVGSGSRGGNASSNGRYRHRRLRCT